MIREVKVLLEDDEKIAVVSTAATDMRDWSGPFEIRVIDDPYRDDYVEIELKPVSNLKRVTK